MTRQRTLKRLIRARMAETGESYSVARRKIISSPESLDSSPRRGALRRWAIPLGVVVAGGAAFAIVHGTKHGGSTGPVYEGGLITTDDVTVSEFACPGETPVAEQAAVP